MSDPTAIGTNGGEPRPRSRRLQLVWILLPMSMLWLFVDLAGQRAWSGRADVERFLLTMGVLFVVYGLAVATVRAGFTAKWLLLWAVAFRVAMIPVGLPAGWAGDLTGLVDDLQGEVTLETYLLYDNDVWRYLWDGHLGSMGADVYGLSPADIERCSDDGDPRCEALLAEDRWQEIHGRVSYPEYRTVYPPLAQALFRLSTRVAPGSALAWRLLMIAFDSMSCVLLILLLKSLHRDPRWMLIYGWNPLAIKELAGSAHVDAALICGLLAAVWATVSGRFRLGLMGLGVVLLIKPTPVFALPLFLRRAPIRHWWILPIMGAVAFLPFFSSIATYFQSLSAFAKDWAFNAGPWNLFLWLGGELGLSGRTAADTMSLLAAVTVVAWIARNDDGSPEAMIRGLIWILGAYLLFSPTVMPWYLLWVLPWIAIQPNWTWPVLTAACLLSYWIYVDGTEYPWILAAEYLLVVGALVWDGWRKRRGSATECVSMRER